MNNMLVMWNLLNSKKFAIYVFSTFLVLLVVSTFLPNHYTLSEKQWYELENSKPVIFWIASRFSTPFLVEHPVFIVVSLFLFLSTLVCTITRVSTWLRSRASEFSKDKAFSFEKYETSGLDANKITAQIETVLSQGRWTRTNERTGDATTISGEKGMSGFWGSIVFHAGLILCFLAAPMTILTNFRSELVLTENVLVPLTQGFASHEDKDPAKFPDVRVMVHDVRGEYYKGQYKSDFSGRLSIGDSITSLDLPFAVNRPASFRGYDFQLHEYGYSPHVVINRKREQFFDYYLNLRHPDTGDHFEIGEGLRALVMFFPDFMREGDRIWTKTKEPNNPVTMVKIYKGDVEVFKGLFRPGEAHAFGEYRIALPDYKRWVNLIVVRESGILLVIFGFLLGVAGLFARFLSNERRIEFELVPASVGTLLTVRGYSRYYPAFLEKEVLTMARKVIADN